MTFDEMLAQVLELLQREKRVSYRALKVRFQLDDDLLEAVKDELIYAKKLAVDEENRVLVWTGDMPSGQAVAPQHTPTTQPPAAQEQPSSQVALLSPAPHAPPDAERRQLTVMFCDLVDSTRLSSQLDPEDYRNMVRAYQTACTEVIRRYDGHIAQLLGDGLLIYFGYPHAHEDDAQRAVRTGLGILAAMGDLNTRLPQDKGIQLALRLGIHTGLVVIGEMGGAGRQEQLALGEVPNVCSRIQGLAEPNTIAISAATYRLVQGFFDCQALDEHTLRGVSQPLNVYRVLGESGVHSRLDIVSTRGLTPLVGREQEVGLLLERWNQVKAEQGQMVLLRGDAGIGKSRLVQVLKDHVAHEPHVRWECRSSEYSQNTALFPLTDLFQRLLRFEAEDAPDEKLRKLEQALSQYRLLLEESVQLFAPLFLLPIPEDRYPALNLSSQRMRQRTLEALVAMLLELAEHQPVIFILEDLHWTDPTTLELLNLVIDQTPTASVLVLLTCRPHFQPAWHHRSYLSEITVNRISHVQVEQIVTGMTEGKTFPAEVLAQIIEKTDGVPLFVEELTKAILESGQLKALNRHYELTGSLAPFAIPATLQDSLMARLDRLVTAKGIAQIGATIGRQFSYVLLQAVSQLDASTLQRELGRLIEAELVYQRGLPPHAIYIFKHALIQDAAYQSLLKSTRQGYHQRIAQVLETQFPETTEGQPELLAHHYTEAGLIAQAVDYWHKAGQRAAIERSAHAEAISHLTKGLEFLKTLPETPQRLQHDVDMHIALGASLLATKGHAAPEVEQTYLRAQQLCAHLDDPHQLFPVLRGLWQCYTVRGEYLTARELGEQLLSLAQQVGDASMLCAAHRALGSMLFYAGAVADAHTHFAQGIALYDPQQHHVAVLLYGEDVGVICHNTTAWTLWYLGYPDQALARSHEAVTLAQQVAHPFSLVLALSAAALFHQLRREGHTAQEYAEAAISLTTEQGFQHWRAYSAILRGWALAQQGQAKEGIEQINQGLMDYRATGAEAMRPYFLALLAEAYGTTGEPEAGLTVLTEALTQADKTGERWWEPELYRIKGELLLQLSSDNQAEAETCFRHALEIARSQQAKSLELRTATSVAKLWQQQGKRQEAHDLLAPVYNWFTEGFDTADLHEAKALLEELA
jgi:class 3 adenylate cyclase/predicted ATPase/energy-coupling factor transporter ATP-binding protein EcfA2